MHLFFDLDGTLTDSCQGIIRCVNYALGELGCAAEPDDRLRAMIGQPLTAIFGAVMTGAGDDVIDRAIEAYRVRFNDVGMFENAVYPGIPDALQRLRDDGHRLQVVTAKPAVSARKVLAHFDLLRFFEAVHGPELTDRGCDKALLVARALAHAGGEAGPAAMIGDRVDDVRAANANGVRAVGAGWGYGTREELISAGAEYVAADAAALLAYLRPALH